MNKALKRVLLGLMFVVSVTVVSTIVVSADNGEVYTDEEYPYGEYSYEYDQQTKEATLIAAYVEGDSLDFIVPETITINNEAYTVTKIGSPDRLPVVGSRKFLHFQVPNTIKEFGDGSFYDVTFPETILLPDGVEKIGVRAFATNKGLKQLTIPASVKTIGEEAFNDSTLEKVIFSEGLVDIGSSAFAYNHLKGTVTLPESVQTLGSYAFAGNTELTSVNLPSSFTKIPDGLLAITGVANLDFLKSQPNIKEIGKHAFKFNTFNGLPTILTIPDTIETIGDGAFAGHQQAGANWSTIEEINLSNHVKSVGAQTFYEQPLKYINVPQNQAPELKEVLSTAMEGVKEATIIRDGHQGYAAGTLTDYRVNEGDKLTFQAFSENKYQLNTTSFTWEPYKPQVQWYKDGQLLAASTTDTLTLSDIKATDAGTYYAVVDGKRLSDIHVAIGEEEVSSIIVRYVDQNGTELLSAQTVTGSIGASYDISTPTYLLTIDGYVLDESKMPANVQGVFTAQAQTVTFVYQQAVVGATDPKQDTPPEAANAEQTISVVAEQTVTTETSADPANVQQSESNTVLPQTGMKQDTVSFDLLIGSLFIATASILLRKRKNI